MRLIAYLDEAGDHALAAPDRDFPVFALSLLVVDTAAYARRIVPAVYALKLDLWGHEGVILHSCDIRKAQRPFRFPDRAWPSWCGKTRIVRSMRSYASISFPDRRRTAPH